MVRGGSSEYLCAYSSSGADPACHALGQWLWEHPAHGCATVSHHDPDRARSNRQPAIAYGYSHIGNQDAPPPVADTHTTYTNHRVAVGDTRPTHRDAYPGT
jgi:hypothetical protein